jgi:hypothetical protein
MKAVTVLAALLLAAACLGPPGMAFLGDDPAGPRAGIVRGGDLLAFWGGAAVLHEGLPAELYVRRTAAVHQRAVWKGIGSGYRLVYPPPVYQLLQPAVPLGYPWAMRLTILLLGLATAGGLWLLSGLVIAPGPRWLRFALLFGSPAALILTFTGQMGGLWLLSVGLGFAGLWCGRDGWGGAALALCCAKPTVGAAALICIVCAGRWRAVAGFVAGAFGLLLLSLAAGGFEAWRAWVEMMIATPEVGQTMWLFPPRQLTLRTLVALPAWKGAAAPALGGLGVLLGGFLVAHIVRAGRRGAAELEPLRVAALFSAALLAIPHLFDYDIALHAPGWLASAALLASGRAARPRLGWVLLVAAWCSPLLWPAAHYARLSLGSAALLAWVLWMGAELRAGGALVDSAAQ